jgi:hypothetical protein
VVRIAATRRDSVTQKALELEREGMGPRRLVAPRTLDSGVPTRCGQTSPELAKVCKSAHARIDASAKTAAGVLQGISTPQGLDAEIYLTTQLKRHIDCFVARAEGLGR